MNDKNSKTSDTIESKVAMNKLIFIKPSEKYIDEIRAYRQAFIDDGGHFNGDSGLRKFEDINAWIEQCNFMENKETVPNPNWVEAEQFMLVNEGENRILGMINFRHYLNDYLAEYAGHIGYGVCPSERRKGYAKVMLSLCLNKCHERGLDKVLITCDEDNEASRRAILACGGVFDRKAIEDKEILERYWIMLGPKNDMTCYCGHDCSRCVTYLATVRNDDELRNQSQQFYKDMFGYDIPLYEIHCMGGRSDDVLYLCKDCSWMKCAKEKGLSSCSNCMEYLCKPLKEYQEKYVNKCNQI